MTKLQLKKPPANTEVIRKIEDLLQLAKEGNIQCIAIAAVLSANDVLTCWECPDNAFVLLGALDYLKSSFSDTCIA
jgi:hypothetical protein